MTNVMVMNDSIQMRYLYPELSQAQEAPATYGYNKRISLIRQGLPVSSLFFFQKQTRLTAPELANILNISLRTFQRYEQSKTLPSPLTEKLLKLNELYELADQSLNGGPVNTTQWLRASNNALQQQNPLQLLDTYEGLFEVKNILGRIAHGVY